MSISIRAGKGMYMNAEKTSEMEAMTRYKFMLLALFAVVLYTASISAAYANPGTWTPMGAVLCQIVYMVEGNLGRGLGTLAIIIIGAGATLGKVSWGLAITVGVGVSIIFNAPSILITLIGVDKLNSC